MTDILHLSTHCRWAWAIQWCRAVRRHPRAECGEGDLSGEVGWIQTSFVFPEGDCDKRRGDGLMWRSARAAPQIDVALTWNELPEGGKLYSVLGYDSRSSGDGGWGCARVRQSVLCVCLSVCLFVCGAVCCFMNEQTEEWVPGVKDKEVDSEEGFENQNCKSTSTVNSLLFYVGFCCCFLFFTFECPCLISLLLLTPANWHSPRWLRVSPSVMKALVSPASTP